MNETRYNIYPKVQYGTEQKHACPRNRSVETLAGVPKHWSCIRAKALVMYTCQSTDHMYVSAHVIEASQHYQEC